jgi:hypothetical protein
MCEIKKVAYLVKNNNSHIKKFKKNFFFIRYMIPFDIKCLSCCNIINRGRKINAIKENIHTEKHLEIYMFRFYFKCIYCLKGITIRTNLKHSNYLLEINSKNNTVKARQKFK